MNDHDLNAELVFNKPKSAQPEPPTYHDEVQRQLDNLKRLRLERLAREAAAQ
jgi:hypothetical protein